MFIATGYYTRQLPALAADPDLLDTLNQTVVYPTNDRDAALSVMMVNDDYDHYMFMDLEEETVFTVNRVVGEKQTEFYLEKTGEIKGQDMLDALAMLEQYIADGKTG